MTPGDLKRDSIMLNSSRTGLNLPKEPVKQAAQVVSKKLYRKPVLQRLGVLKSVAGSGIVW
jgi:hypothetical protein